RHERVEAVPERERVAGVQTAVLELVDGAEVEVAELDELADTCKVEEPVAADDARHVPERDPEPEPAGEHQRTAARPRHAQRPAKPCTEREGPDHAEEPEREHDVAVHREDDSPRGEDRPEAEDEG